MKLKPALLPIFLLVLMFSPNVVFGCECSIPTVCQAFTRAEGVFIGKVTSVKNVESTVISRVLVTFEVEKIYKGESRTSEAVEFEVSDCFPVSFAVGERYFVYKDPARDKFVCNRTDTVANSAAEIEYADKIASNNDLRTIGGFIHGLSDEELKLASVIIESGNERHDVKIDQHGAFTFSSDSGSDQIVRISLPFDSNVHIKDLLGIYPFSGRTIEYDLKLGPGECSYREINVLKAETPDNKADQKSDIWRRGEYRSVRVGVDTREKALKEFGEPVWNGDGPDETGQSNTEDEVWDQFENIDEMFSRVTVISSAKTGIVSLIEAQVPSLPLRTVLRKFFENYERKEYIDVRCDEADPESLMTIEGTGPYSSVYYVYPDLGIAIVTQGEDTVIAVQYRSAPVHPAGKTCGATENG